MGTKRAITLQVPAIAASERQSGGGHLANFTEFQQRIARLGIGDAVLLRPLAYFGLAFWDWGVISGPELRERERRIHEVLFPSIAFDATDHCPPDNEAGRKRWRNAKCDVLAMWCHIHYGGDIFVTRDRDFLKHSARSRLEQMGANKIATPEDTLAIVKTESQLDERPV